MTLSVGPSRHVTWRSIGSSSGRFDRAGGHACHGLPPIGVRRLPGSRGRLRPRPPGVTGVGILGNAFISALRSKSNKNIGTYAVKYPADTEVDIGANDMSAHIQSMMNNCPDTRLVLGGYSLGAAVTDVVLAVPFDFFRFNNPLPPGADQHIAAVALFGNGIAWVAPITNFNPRLPRPDHRVVPRCRSDLQPGRPDTWQDNWPAHLAECIHPGGHGEPGGRLRRWQDLVDHPELAGDPRASLELVIWRVVHADEREAVRRRGREVAGALRRRQQRGAPTGFAAVLADGQQARRPTSAPSTNRTRRR